MGSWHDGSNKEGLIMKVAIIEFIDGKNAVIEDIDYADSTSSDIFIRFRRVKKGDVLVNWSTIRVVEYRYKEDNENE